MRMSIAALALLGGCSPFCAPVQKAEPAAPVTAADATAPLPLTVSVKDLMEGAIAFSAHVIKQVEGSGAALTNADWGAARVASSDLMAAATLLTTPNDNPIDALRRRDPEWRNLAQALQEAGTDIGTASRARNKNALASATSAMNSACQDCHVRYGVHGQ